MDVATLFLALSSRVTQDETAVELDPCAGEHVVCTWVYEATGSEWAAETVAWIVRVPITIIVIVVAALIINRVVRRLIHRTTESMAKAAERDSKQFIASTQSRERAGERARALESILKATATAAIFILATLLVLSNLGVNVVALIAGAGLLGFAISFGAQSLVKDVIAGISILIEDQYGIGDEVDIGYGPGTVEHVSLRSTAVRDYDGTIWYVPNGEILRVANLSQLWSRVRFDVRIPYEADLDRAREVIGEVAVEIVGEERFAGALREPPDPPIVQELAPDAVLVRQIVWVRRPAVVALERELRVRTKQALQAEGIGIGLPRQEISIV